MKHPSVIPVLLIIALAPAASAQVSGDLDNTFSTDGIATAHFPPAGNDGASCMALQPNGRILVGGSTQQQTGSIGIVLALARFMPDGSLDNDFGTGGLVTTVLGSGSTIDDKILGIAVQPDGRIVVVGATFVNGGGYQAAILRYNSDGSLDNTFSGDGIRVEDIGTGSDDGFFDVVVQPDGGIVVAGTVQSAAGYDAVVARYLADGTPDDTFSADGFEVLDIGGLENRSSALALQADGSIVISGEAGDTFGNSEFMLARFTSTGALDPNFGTNGVVVSTFTTGTDWAYDVAVQPDGKIVASGIVATAAFLGDMGFARYNSNGTLDLTFSVDGWTNVVHGAYSYARSAVVLPDGRIAGGGISGSMFGVAMLLPNGTLDAGFSDDGLVSLAQGSNPNGNALALQPDGKLLFAGQANYGATLNDMVVLRYHTGLNIGLVEFVNAGHAPHVFPNPINQIAALVYELKSSERITIRLMDAQGRVVKTFLDGAQQPSGEQRVMLDMPEKMSVGNYFITISSPEGSLGVRVVKE